MHPLDLEQERIRLDREITFFHFKKAQRIVDRALRQARQQKESFFSNYFTGQYYIVREQYDHALRFFFRALSLRPKDGCTYNDIALCYAELGDYDQAERFFDEGLTKDRDCPALYHNKGWFLNLLGQHKQASLCFHKALELEKDRPESLYSLADSCYCLGDYKSAKKYFSRAASLLKGKSAYMTREVHRRLKDINS